MPGGTRSSSLESAMLVTLQPADSSTLRVTSSTSVSSSTTRTRRRPCERFSFSSDPSTFRDVLPPGGSYDLVLVDLFMPGMDGIEVLQRFSADVRNCASRLYVISACDDESLRALALRSGADGYLTKPLQRSSLLELLAS